MRRWRPTRLVFAAVLLAAMGFAPAGSARSPETAQAPSRARPIATASPHRVTKRRVLRGTRRVARFVVPKGDTVLVTGSLRLTARRDITIAGRLVVSPGAGVMLRSGGTLKIARGSSIGPAPVRRYAVLGPLAPRRAAAIPLVALAGDEIVVDGSVRTEAGQGVQLLVNQRGTVTINGSIQTGDGEDEVARAGGGGDGGSIVVTGGVFGNARVITLGRRARLASGDGGRGFDDARGQLQGSSNPCIDVHGPGGPRQQLFVEGGGGGNGGSIRLLSRNYDLRGRIEVGDGGRGGHAGFAAGGERAKAPDGTPGNGGADVYAQAGSGGNGGSFETSDGDGKARAGSGGDGGSVRVAAGNGAANCDGGRTDARLGAPGRRGKRGAPAIGATEAGTIELQSGGHGGDASDRNHAAGNGGLVRLDNAGSPREPVAVTDYANGGAGFDGCSASPPVNGTPGGNGGVMRAGTKDYAVGQAFRGGRGGNGLPAGSGGNEGSQDRAPVASLDAFRGGPNGSPCPNAAFRYDASNIQLGWVNPFTGETVTGTYAISFCGTNPFNQIWTYAGTSTGGPYGFNGSFRFDVNPLVGIQGYNNLDGSFVASVSLRFSLAGQPPSLSLTPTVVVAGATSIVNPGPQQIELVGRFVASCA